MALPELYPAPWHAGHPNPGRMYIEQRRDGLWVYVWHWPGGPDSVEGWFVRLLKCDVQSKSPMHEDIVGPQHQRLTELEAECVFDAYMNGFTPEVTP